MVDFTVKVILHESLLPNWQQSVDEVIFPHLSKKRKRVELKYTMIKKKHAQILILLPFIILCQVCAKGEKNPIHANLYHCGRHKAFGYTTLTARFGNNLVNV